MKRFLSVITLCISLASIAQQKTTSSQSGTQKIARILPAAERLNQYLPLLKGKKVAVFANQTSTVGNSHLVDTLQKSGVLIKVIFGPEHGFRGTADAGEKVESAVDD